MRNYDWDYLFDDNMKLHCNNKSEVRKFLKACDDADLRWYGDDRIYSFKPLDNCFNFVFENKRLLQTGTMRTNTINFQDWIKRTDSKKDTNMNKTEIDNALSKIDKSIAEAQQSLEQAKKTKEELTAMMNKPKEMFPVIGDKYFFVSNKFVAFNVFEDDATDKQIFCTKRIYKTRQEAEATIEDEIRFLDIHYKYLKLIQRLNNGVELDWKDRVQRKHSLHLWDSELYMEINNTSKSKSSKYYCLDSNLYLTAIDEIGENNLIFMLKWM